MSAWLQLALPTLTVVGVLTVLGGPVALALRLRGFFAAIVALPAAFAVLALASIVSPIAGVSWSLLPPLALTAGLSIVLVTLRKWLAPRGSTSRPHRVLAPLASAAIGGAAIATTIVMGIKAPDAISQTYDANFHLNAVRQILDTGNASPFAMDLSAPGSAVFYPTLWHSLVALTVQLSGTTIPLATNATVFVVAAVVWPVGAVALGRAIAGPSRSVTVISGVVAAAFPNFPLSLTAYGVLYPNLLSIALFPFVTVSVLQLLGLSQARRSERSSPGAAWLLAFGAMGAAVFAHPNAIHITLLWLIAPLLAVTIRAFHNRPVPGWGSAVRSTQMSRGTRTVSSVSSLLLLALGIGIAWRLGQTSDNPWAGKHTPFAALRDAVGMTPHLEGHSWPITILFVLGVTFAWRFRNARWALGSATVLLGVYIIADGFEAAAWRTSLLAPWYSDPWRLAALVALGALPLVVLGASAAWGIAREGIRRFARLSPSPLRFQAVGSLVAIAFLLAATQGAGAFAGVRFVSSQYAAGEQARLLSSDERELLEKLPELVEPDATIINNPWNGGALAYALSGHKVLTPHTGGNFDPRIADLMAEITEGSPAACELSREFEAEYILDFGTNYLFGDISRVAPYEPISGITSAPALAEVEREGDAVLYRIIGCS